jgi:hypothetical protein
MSRLPHALLLSFGFCGAAWLHAASPETPAAPSASPEAVSDLEDRMRRMQALMNQIELQAEQTKAGLDKAKPQPISLGPGQLLLQEALYGPNFESASGAQAVIGFNLDPQPGVHGAFDVEIIGSVAPDRTLPQQELNQFYTKNQRVLLKKSEIRFESDDVLARAFRMVPRPDLYEEGDMFYLFPAVDDTNKYFRQSGRAVPNGAELQFKDGWLKGLDLWGGDELLYGVTKPTAFARFKNKLGPVDFAVMGLWIQDPTFGSGSIVEHHQEAWIRVPVFKSGFNLDVAAVRRATRVGQSYTVTRTVPAGSGVMGTNVAVDNIVTGEADAWGTMLRLRGLSALPFVEEASLTASYSAPLAGNLESVNALLSFRPQRYTLLSVEGGWQMPLVGPGSQPILIGTPSVPLGTVPGTGPRPYGSLVTVSQDPISGVNNREMQSAQLTLEFNPGKGWFYKWRPRIVDAWNFNTDLDTPIANALSVRTWNLPTGTDLGSYIDATGNRVPEAPGSSGQYPSKGWLYSLSDILAFRAWQAQCWLVFGMGDQVAGLSPNGFTAPNAWASQYLNLDGSLRWQRWLLSGGYGENLYGPDDWYQTFGLIIGNVTRASIAYSVGASQVTVQYTGWRDKDPNVMHFTGATVPTTPPFTASAPLDQVMVSYALNF